MQKTKNIGLFLLLGIGAMNCFSNDCSCNNGLCKKKSSDQACCKENKSETAKKNTKEKLLNAKTITLKNGLQVVLVKDSLVPRATVGVLYKVGSADDPEDLIGLSHMTEHMFFHGSKKFPEVGKSISKIGGYTNAFTWYDGTFFFAECGSENFEKILEIESDRMANFKLVNNKIFLKEQKAVLEERLMCVDTQPLGLPLESINMSMSPQHNYGKEIIGAKHQIMNFTIEAIMAHYQKWYKPNNAVLIVIGDVDEKKLFELADKYFGKIKPGKAIVRKRIQNQITEDLYQNITYYSDKVSATKIKILYKALHRSSASLKKCTALSIGLQILFGRNFSEINRYFLDEKKWVSDITYEFAPGYDQMPISISISLMKGVDEKQFLERFYKKLNKILKKGISKEDFDLAVKSFIGSTKMSLASQKAVLFTLLELAQGLSLGDIEDTIEVVKSLKIEDLNSALNEFLGQRPVGVVEVRKKNITKS